MLSGSYQDLLQRSAGKVAGEDPCVMPWDNGTVLWLYGTAMIEARIAAGGAIELCAFLVIGPETSGELQQLLSWFTTGLDVGRLETDEDGDIVLRHRVPQRRVDEHLEEDLRAFCRVADGLDDLLCERLGGRSSSQHLDAAVHFVLSSETKTLPN